MVVPSMDHTSSCTHAVKHASVGHVEIHVLSPDAPCGPEKAEKKPLSPTEWEMVFGYGVE